MCAFIICLLALEAQIGTESSKCAWPESSYTVTPHDFQLDVDLNAHFLRICQAQLRTDGTALGRHWLFKLGGGGQEGAI